MLETPDPKSFGCNLCKTAKIFKKFRAHLLCGPLSVVPRRPTQYSTILLASELPQQNFFPNLIVFFIWRKNTHTDPDPPQLSKIFFEINYKCLKTETPDVSWKKPTKLEIFETYLKNSNKNLEKFWRSYMQIALPPDFWRP